MALYALWQRAMRRKKHQQMKALLRVANAYRAASPRALQMGSYEKEQERLYKLMLECLSENEEEVQDLSDEPYYDKEDENEMDRLEVFQGQGYLGVILDHKLTWRQHVDYKVSKARNSLWACRRVVGSSWGLSPKVVHWLYTTIVRPSLIYGSIVWWTCIKTEATRAKLNKVQRLACLSITSAVRTTPLSAIETLLNLPPLDLVIQGEARKTGFRLWSQGSWTFMNPGKGRSTILAELHEDCPILLARSDTVSPTHRFNRKFTVVFPSREEWKSKKRQLIEGGGQVWYTDGSLAREGSGSGVYGPRTRLSFPLGGHTTVFQAEVYAILACVNRIREIDGSRRRITICSDSQAAIQALSAWKITSGLVLECRRALDDISAKHKVSLMWVPGHAGVKGNEMADHLARMGSGNSFVGPEPALGLSANLVRKTTGEWIQNQHSLRWNNISGHLRQARELLAGPAERIGRFCLLTGHNTFRRHLVVTRVVNDPTCTWCGEEEESSAHILCRCETLGYHRQTMLGSRTLEPIEIKRIGPKNVLAFAKRAGLRN
ncbi:unnamed protein product [Callosobruchus maculatus]|uniref:ribonuclease H n=1 Tax=Callosobruchus maculatus TaxID=64391 RepID=A0A653DS20_CALMS|nr:unnamed protein product [Callosobruchus maculatus]